MKGPTQAGLGTGDRGAHVRTSSDIDSTCDLLAARHSARSLALESRLDCEKASRCSRRSRFQPSSASRVRSRRSASARAAASPGRIALVVAADSGRRRGGTAPPPGAVDEWGGEWHGWLGWCGELAAAVGGRKALRGRPAWWEPCACQAFAGRRPSHPSYNAVPASTPGRMALPGRERGGRSSGGCSTTPGGGSRAGEEADPPSNEGAAATCASRGARAWDWLWVEECVAAVSGCRCCG